MSCKYRIYCNTESAYVETDFVDTIPTECPNDKEHQIDTESITKIEIKDCDVIGKIEQSALLTLLDEINTLRVSASLSTISLEDFKSAVYDKYDTL